VSRQKPPEVEVKPVDAVHTEAEIAVAKAEAEREAGTPFTTLDELLQGTSPEDFNQHVKNLVANFSQEIVQELEQRLSDVELLLQQPQGAVTFVQDLNAEPQVRDAVDGQVPWYTPPYMD
jgi:hypothetical protein